MVIKLHFIGMSVFNFLKLYLLCGRKMLNPVRILEGLHLKEKLDIDFFLYSKQVNQTKLRNNKKCEFFYGIL